ncbi:MAG: DUF7694 domain-containing protein [Pseudomonas sp.]
MKTDRIQRRLLAKENTKQPQSLRLVPAQQWQEIRALNLVEVWRSRGFLVQVYAEGSDFQRMSVCRTFHDGETWADQISWEELMQLKRECGRGDKDALEVFPADADVVNVANMRHLFFPPEPVAFKWKSKQ